MKQRALHWNKRVRTLNICERECTKCHRVMSYKYFAKMKSWPYWHRCDCLECVAKLKREKRAIGAYKKTEQEYREKYKSRDTQKIIEKLDNLYYCDKQIRKNRTIIKSVKKITRKEAVESKVEYLLSRWIPKELLERVYKFRESLYIYESGKKHIN
jgi:hypothetical protein